MPSNGNASCARPAPSSNRAAARRRRCDLAACGAPRHGHFFAALESRDRYWYDLFLDIGCVGEEDPMSRHAGNFTGSVLAGAVCLAGSLSISAMAQGLSPPDFAPNPSAAWFAYSRTFIPPASGAGPVRPDPAHPHVTNDDFRATGKQPTIAVADPDSPILQPWAR